MRNAVILFLIIILFLFNLSVLANGGEEGQGGMDAGNGGRGVACIKFENDDIEMSDVVRFYDLLLGSMIGSIKYYDVKQPKVRVQKIIKFYKDFFPDFGRFVEIAFYIVKRNIDLFEYYYSQGVPLPISLTGLTQDYGNVQFSKDLCKDGYSPIVLQIAKFKANNDPIIDIFLYSKMSPLDKAAFMIHESVYKVLVQLGLSHGEAAYAIRITYVSFAENIPIKDKVEFIQAILNKW